MGKALVGAMQRSFVLLSVCAVHRAVGAELELSGETNAIFFGAEHGQRAIFRGSCEGDRSHVAWLSPTSVDAGVGNVTVHLRYVAPFCAASHVREPCASAPGEEEYPPLFYCHYEGPAGVAVQGPAKQRG